MYDNDYIDRIVSNIKNKSEKESLKAEITDHYLEKQQWYEEIGYDPRPAAEKAEEDIGDPDVIGAQLVLISNHGKSDWLFCPFLIAYIVYYIINQKFVFDWLVTDYVINLVLFISFIVLFLISLKNHLKVSAAASCVLIFLTNVLYFVNTLAFILNGHNASACFFRPITGFYRGELLYEFGADPFSDTGYCDTKIKTTAMLLTVLFALTVISGTIFSVLMSIKVKKLKNTLLDCKISAAVRRVFISIAIVTIIFALIQLFMAIGFVNNYQTSVSEELTNLSEKSLDEIQNYHADKDAYIESVNSSTDTQYRVAFQHLTYKNIVPPYYIQTSASRMYGFNGKALRVNTKEQGEKVIEFAKSGEYLDDAPKPYSLVYDYKEDRLTIIYDCDYYGVMSLEFKYENGRFKLAGKHKIRTQAETEFTPEQTRQYEQALNDYNKARYSYFQDDLPADYFKSNCKIYGISFVEPDGLYEVYQFSRLNSDVDPDYIQPNSDLSGTEVVSVAFEDGKAVIKNVKRAKKVLPDNMLGMSDIGDDDRLHFSIDEYLDGEEMLFSDAAYRRVPLWRINSKDLSYFHR